MSRLPGCTHLWWLGCRLRESHKGTQLHRSTTKAARNEQPGRQHEAKENNPSILQFNLCLRSCQAVLKALHNFGEMSNPSGKM